MKRDDWEFMERINQDIEAHKAACMILEVKENTNQDNLKRAYRRAAIKYHPDHNGNTKESNRKFTLVKCAYELLAFDKPCNKLLEEIDSWPSFQGDNKYNLNNSWGHFLWWREKYFDSDGKVKPDKLTFCI